MHGISRTRTPESSTTRGYISSERDRADVGVAFGLCLSLAGWLPISGGIAVMLGANVIGVALAVLGVFFVGFTASLYRQSPEIEFEPEPQETDLGFGKFGRR